MGWCRVINWSCMHTRESWRQLETTCPSPCCEAHSARLTKPGSLQNWLSNCSNEILAQLCLPLCIWAVAAPMAKPTRRPTECTTAPPHAGAGHQMILYAITILSGFSSFHEACQSARQAQQLLLQDATPCTTSLLSIALSVCIFWKLPIRVPNRLSHHSYTLVHVINCTCMHTRQS